MTRQPRELERCSNWRCQPRRDRVPRGAVLENFAAYHPRRMTFERVDDEMDADFAHLTWDNLAW